MEVKDKTTIKKSSGMQRSQVGGDLGNDNLVGMGSSPSSTGLARPRLKEPRPKPVTRVWRSRAITSAISMTASLTPLGRSAAELISINKRFLSSCAPLDRLLGDGLPASHILELSGPPGTAKETLAIKFASSAVSSNDQILFVGETPTQ
jgi:hypothetical protein